MNNLEYRIFRLEGLVNTIAAQVASLIAQVAALAQNATVPTQSGMGGGSSTGFFVVMAPASGTISGTWSGSAPTGAGSFTGTVYQVELTGTVTSLGTQTIANWMPAALANSKACICLPAGKGTYGVIAQSCT